MTNNALNGAEMIEFERTRLNLWHVGAIAVSIAVNAWAVAVVYTTMNFNDRQNADKIAELQTQTERVITDMKTAQQNEIQARIERGKQTDANFKILFDQMPQFQIISQQINRLTELTAQNTSAIAETNKRMERVIDATQTKLDTIISRQAEQSTDIKVIQSQLAEQQRSQRTGFTMPEYPRRPK